jgi:hypothetical protein
MDSRPNSRRLRLRQHRSDHQLPRNLQIAREERPHCPHWSGEADQHCEVAENLGHSARLKSATGAVTSML